MTGVRETDRYISEIKDQDETDGDMHSTGRQTDRQTGRQTGCVWISKSKSLTFLASALGLDLFSALDSSSEEELSELEELSSCLLSFFPFTRIFPFSSLSHTQMDTHTFKQYDTSGGWG